MIRWLTSHDRKRSRCRPHRGGDVELHRSRLGLWRPRSSFTLVELLVVVSVMSILGGMMSIALSSARQEARIKRAQSEVRTISVILQQKLNDINLAPVRMLGNTANAANSLEQNRVMMLARRDVMRMIMPQCRADLIYPPARLQFLQNNGTVSAVKIEQPSEWARMRRIAGFTFHSGIQIESAAVPSAFSIPVVDTVAAYFGTNASNALLRTRLGNLRGYTIDLTTAPWPANPSGPPTGETWTRDFESAECLYLILATTDMFGTRALDQFNERSIANLDGDAVPEIVDPWGNPYEFIREPVGRVYQAIGQTVLPTEPHPDGVDPADYLRTDFRFLNNDNTNPPTMLDDPFKLTPLVISAGQDGEFGIRRSFDRQGDATQDRMGISPRRSSSMLQLTSPPIATLPGTFQYPDPYGQLRANASAPYTSGADNLVIRYADQTEATLFGWHGYIANGSHLPAVGLGAALFEPSGKREAAFSDNIASDQSQ